MDRRLSCHGTQPRMVIGGQGWLAESSSNLGEELFHLSMPTPTEVTRSWNGRPSAHALTDHTHHETLAHVSLSSPFCQLTVSPAVICILPGMQDVNIKKQKQNLANALVLVSLFIN